MIVLDIPLRLLAATFFGAFLGIGHYTHGRVAGMRTHMLVTLGSALFTILSIEFADFFVGSGIISDPSRIAAQILTGIGFIGGGVIIKTGFSVTGITTAASLWVSAAIGLATGAGFYFYALIATIIAFVIINVLNHVENLWKKNFYRTLAITLDKDGRETEKILKLLKKYAVVKQYSYLHDYTKDLAHLNLILEIYTSGLVDEKSRLIFTALEKNITGIREIKWEGA